MTNFTSDNIGDNIIDLREVTDRVEELRDNLTQRHEEGQFASSFEDWIKNSIDHSEPVYAAFPDDGADVQDEIEEYHKLTELLDELRGNGGDHQWEGHWYPLTLIHESHFEAAMDELIEDIGDLPKDLPPYLSVSVNYAALRQDYAEVTIAGTDHTYLYR